MHSDIDDVFYSNYSHQHVSTDIPAIISVILLQEHKCTNLVHCVTITP